MIRNVDHAPSIPRLQQNRKSTNYLEQAQKRIVLEDGIQVSTWFNHDRRSFDRHCELSFMNEII